MISALLQKQMSDPTSWAVLEQRWVPLTRLKIPSIGSGHKNPYSGTKGDEVILKSHRSHYDGQGSCGHGDQQCPSVTLTQHTLASCDLGHLLLGEGRGLD